MSYICKTFCLNFINLLLIFRSCECDTFQNCSCLHGYTGTGKECGIDTDLDGYPNHLIDCVSDQNHINCSLDNCPSVANSDQTDCDMNGKGDECDGPICPFDIDRYGIAWQCGVGNDLLFSETCIGGIGIANRVCNVNGNWLDTDISQCASSKLISQLIGMYFKIHLIFLIL